MEGNVPDLILLQQAFVANVKITNRFELLTLRNFFSIFHSLGTYLLLPTTHDTTFNQILCQINKNWTLKLKCPIHPRHSPIHPRHFWQGRFKTCFGPSYFLLQLSNCMMETCMLLAGVRVHEHW